MLRYRSGTTLGRLNRTDQCATKFDAGLQELRSEEIARAVQFHARAVKIAIGNACRAAQSLLAHALMLFFYGKLVNQSREMTYGRGRVVFGGDDGRASRAREKKTCLPPSRPCPLFQTPNWPPPLFSHSSAPRQRNFDASVELSLGRMRSFARDQVLQVARSGGAGRQVPIGEFAPPFFNDYYLLPGWRVRTRVRAKTTPGSPTRPAA